MVYVFFADGFEEIEGLTVVDILRRAEIETKTVGVSGGKKVTGAHGIEIVCDVKIKAIKDENFDMLVFPGGMPGSKNLDENIIVDGLLKRAFKENKKVSAICAAPMILGKRGYLEDKKATCYPGFEKYLNKANVKDVNVIKDGNIITSKGPGTAFEFAFEIVKTLKDDNTAHLLSVSMQYERIIR